MSGPSPPESDRLETVEQWRIVDDRTESLRGEIRDSNEDSQNTAWLIFVLGAGLAIVLYLLAERESIEPIARMEGTLNILVTPFEGPDAGVGETVANSVATALAADSRIETRVLGEGVSSADSFGQLLDTHGAQILVVGAVAEDYRTIEAGVFVQGLLTAPEIEGFYSSAALRAAGDLGSTPVAAVDAAEILSARISPITRLYLAVQLFEADRPDQALMELDQVERFVGDASMRTDQIEELTALFKANATLHDPSQTELAAIRAFEAALGEHPQSNRIRIGLVFAELRSHAQSCTEGGHSAEVRRSIRGLLERIAEPDPVIALKVRFAEAMLAMCQAFGTGDASEAESAAMAWQGFLASLDSSDPLTARLFAAERAESIGNLALLDFVFHGQEPAQAADLLAVAASEAVHAERQITYLLLSASLRGQLADTDQCRLALMELERVEAISAESGVEVSDLSARRAALECE